MVAFAAVSGCHAAMHAPGARPIGRGSPETGAASFHAEQGVVMLTLRTARERGGPGPARRWPQAVPEAFVPKLLTVLREGYGWARFRRSEERRGGTECGSTCRSRWSPDH